jgi:transcriptional regulator with XRE-family HTH domain
MKTLKLRQIRVDRGLSQVGVAAAMGVSQPAVSKIERRPDPSVSVLRDYIAALGGKLEIVARFPDGVVPLPIDSDRPEVRYDRLRPPLRKVAEQPPVVAPEWLDDVDRIRAMTPKARMEEVTNLTAFFAVARRRG